MNREEWINSIRGQALQAEADNQLGVALSLGVASVLAQHLSQEGVTRIAAKLEPIAKELLAGLQLAQMDVIWEAARKSWLWAMGTADPGPLKDQSPGTP